MAHEAFSLVVGDKTCGSFEAAIEEVRAAWSAYKRRVAALAAIADAEARAQRESE